MGVIDYTPKQEEPIPVARCKYPKFNNNSIAVSVNKEPFDKFVDDPTHYLNKILKKGNNPASLEYLEEILAQLDSINDIEIGEINSDNKEIAKILVYMVYIQVSEFMDKNSSKSKFTNYSKCPIDNKDNK